MINEADLNILVSNVVSENRYKHCRLCLKDLEENYVKIEDCVSCDDQTVFQPLAEILCNLVGNEMSEDIPGVDGVCAECVEKTVECHKFIEKCKRTTELIYKIFNNLSEALDIKIELSNKDQRLYVVVGENESKVVLLDKEEPKKFATNIKELVYTCETCNTNIDNIQDYKAHSLVCHDTIIQSCDVCNLTFTSETALEEHMKTGHGYKCPECDQYESTEESLEQHCNKQHTEYVCKECGKSYQGLDKLQAHEEKHNTKSQCPKCGKTYLTKDFYLKHVKLCLSDQIDRHPFRGKIQKTYFCEKCGKGYSTTGGLRVHERFVHGNAKPHVCEHCGKKFTAPSYLKIHMVKHTGEKKFKCSICNNNFVSKEALLYHTRRHTGEKPYSCKLCNERFVNASARAEHIKFKHSGPSLTCEICDRKFFTANFLKQHISRHHDPSSKLYSGRSMIPPNMPGEQNMRIKVEIM
ncbi:zinc finger protein 664-like [Pectinophora gossypiella]|uniref:zinc finger protein 664-like n=1 Tax=Pectinophora gossypiella TaxID=13191 RepID=UPI00214EF1C7|nr:zinc finger protein 664-like [Pectinophora gossypiella]